jgi:hypothetical protein
MDRAECIVALTTDQQDAEPSAGYRSLVPNAAAKSPPRWIDLIPAGVFAGRDGRGPYCNEDPEQIIAETRKLGMTAGLPIDFDHAIDLGAPQGQPAPAAGWIKELRQVNGVIQGRVEWTAAGTKALAAKLYRYISPVFEFSDDGTVQRLLRAAVTNNPNLYLKAIASVETGTAPAAAESCRRAMNQIRKALGAPSTGKLQAAQDSLTRATVQAASRFLSADDLELCGRQGVNVARFALAKRDRMTGTPLVMVTPFAERAPEVTNPRETSTSSARYLEKALDEISAFLGNQQDKDRLQHLLNASACVSRATKERDQPSARFSQASRLSQPPPVVISHR